MKAADRAKDHDIFFVYPFNYPSEKAHAIQVIKTCIAMAKSNRRILLWVKSRAGSRKIADEFLEQHFGPQIPANFEVSYLPRNNIIAGLMLRAAMVAASRHSVFYCRRLGLVNLCVWLAPRRTIVELHKYSSKSLAAARKANAVVAITTTLREKLIESGIPGERISVIPSATDLHMSPCGERSSNHSRKRIVYIGKLQEWKGVDIMIRALPQLQVEALIVGGKMDGPDVEAERLKDLAEELGVAERVEFTGYVPQKRIPAMVRKGDIAVLPTRGGGTQDISTSPLKLFDYMAMGLPVVSVNLPAIAAVVTHRESALLFQDGDVDGLVLQLRQLVEDTKLYDRLRERGLAIVKEYTWDMRAAAIERIVEKLLQGRPRTGSLT